MYLNNKNYLHVTGISIFSKKIVAKIYILHSSLVICIKGKKIKVVAV